MPDRYHEGALQEWEVTATVTVTALSEDGALTAAKHLMDPDTETIDWEARRA